MLSFHDMHLELGVCWLHGGGHDTVRIIVVLVHLELNGCVVDSVDRSTDFHVCGNGGEIFTIWVDQSEPLVLRRMILHIVDVGQIKLNLANQVRLKEALCL